MSIPANCILVCCGTQVSTSTNVLGLEFQFRFYMLAPTMTNVILAESIVDLLSTNSSILIATFQSIIFDMIQLKLPHILLHMRIKQHYLSSLASLVSFDPISIGVTTAFQLIMLNFFNTFSS